MRRLVALLALSVVLSGCCVGLPTGTIYCSPPPRVCSIWDINCYLGG